MNENKLSSIISCRVNAMGSVEEILQQLFSLTDELINNSVTAIGIGIPGLVDIDHGIVFDVVNIPSWKEVPLQKQMEDRIGKDLITSINKEASK